MPDLLGQGEAAAEKADDFSVLQAFEIKSDFIHAAVDPRRPNL
ncbi:MAG: hypothetical protein WBM54_02145 [Woeseia sp.]